MFFGSVLTSLCLLSERVLSFMTLSIWTRLVGRDAFFGMGWLPALSGADDGDPWAVDAADVASKRLEAALGSYVGVSQEPGGEFSLVDDDVPLADAPDVWSDGSLVLDGFSGIGVAGVVFMPMHLVLLGLVGDGGTWIYFLHCLMVLVRLVDCIVPFLVLCKLCSGLSFGEF